MLLDNAHLAHEEFCTLAWFREVLCCQEMVLSARASNSSRGGHHQAAVAARVRARVNEKVRQYQLGY